MKAFTYLVVNKLTGKWYYGVRYAKECSEKDMFTKYFTSSTEVKSDIKTFGIGAFSWELRRKFDDVKAALAWEKRVLYRMKVTHNIRSYNKHCQMGFTIKSGEDNTSKRPDVREKLSLAAKNRSPHSQEIIDKISYTKTRNSIRKLFIRNEFVVSKQKKKSYENYLKFMINYKPRCKRMISKLRVILSEISAIKKKQYVRIKRTLRGKCPNISKSKTGGMWFTSPDFEQSKIFRTLDEVPCGWIAGLKMHSKIAKNRLASTGRKHTDAAKESMHRSCSGKKYYTSPDYMQVKVFKKIEDVPCGWIPGVKKTRVIHNNI